MSRRIYVAAICLGVSGGVFAQTVTTGDDVVDFAGPQRVESLPGADGLVSLREAAVAANNTDGPKMIALAMPNERWWHVIPGHATCMIDNAISLTAPTPWWTAAHRRPHRRHGVYSARVATNASGNVTFDAALVHDVNLGIFITFTALRGPTGDTSEFSMCKTVTGDAGATDINHVAIINSEDFFDFLDDLFAANADFNTDGSTNSQDFLDFLTEFFAGC